MEKAAAIVTLAFSFTINSQIPLFSCIFLNSDQKFNVSVDSAEIPVSFCTIYPAVYLSYES